jgi:hypothetical protein
MTVTLKTYLCNKKLLAMQVDGAAKKEISVSDGLVKAYLSPVGNDPRKCMGYTSVVGENANFINCHQGQSRVVMGKGTGWACIGPEAVKIYHGQGQHSGSSLPLESGCCLYDQPVSCRTPHRLYLTTGHNRRRDPGQQGGGKPVKDRTWTFW